MSPLIRADAKIMFAAAYQRRRRAWGFHGGGPGSALYKSIDGGDTWTKLVKDLPEGDQGRIGITVSRGDQPVVYARIEQGLRYDAVDAYAERRAGIYRSVDRGETWERMSDWNPRPTAASQIRVDPNDPERVYLTGTFSFSSDAGRTFEMDRASSGAGDQVLWINPRDSRHLIRGGGAGIAISRDRGETWTNTAPLPATEVSRVSVDMRQPFWVYAGLETHGSWAGPSSPPVDQGSGGEWIRTGDGDGFANVIDPSDNRTLYTSSQFLGLSRLDVVTGERTSIRPGDSKDHADGRRNWEAWSRPLLSRDRAHTRAGANRDAPVIVSPHDPKTIYAATTDLWRSYDRGRTWATLGNRTTSVDRTTLRVMTQLPTETTLSLDDGAPYYPTISAVAESPVQKGVLFVGTDDGNVQLSRDTGRTWLTIANRFPDLPKASYVSAIEMSRLDVQKVYVAFDNHRNDDYTSYLYRTTDGGTTWEAIDGDLPSERVIHVVREDPKNPAVLYVGTALGAYVSADSGSHWVELELNLPRVAVHDLVVHPRDNDLVLATHGRGIWILDNLSAIQGLTPEVLASDAHLFPIEPAESVRQVPPTAAADDAASRPAGAPAGAIVDYYLRSAADAVALTVHDSAGRLVATVDAAGRRGVNRAVWNLGSAGAAVAPGTYTVRLAVRGQTFDRPLVVSDPVRSVDWDAALRAASRPAEGRPIAARIEGLPRWPLRAAEQEETDLTFSAVSRSCSPPAAASRFPSRASRRCPASSPGGPSRAPSARRPAP